MAQLLSQATFFEKYNIKEEDFNRTKLTWEDLSDIYRDYLEKVSSLEEAAISIFRSLSKMAHVHSVRYRVKDAEHLIEKIIRKKRDNSDREITIATYLTEITDLIGIRVLHLFKEEWVAIHRNILDMWNLKETVIAYHRAGDNTDIFKENKCTPKEHNNGYRSIHYIIESQPTKLKVYAEIQVRTIFEEAWSEIDHSVRYPYDMDNPLLTQYLLIFNRLSGSADEMGAFILNLRNHLNKIHADNAIIIKEKEEATRQLQAAIKQLKISEKEKRNLEAKLNNIKKPEIDTWASISTPEWLNSFTTLNNSLNIFNEINTAYKPFQGIGRLARIAQPNLPPEPQRASPKPQKKK
ncbi:hypothetical protein [Alistipes timonensis]|uniref:hypothetical protein n=1 Tax=Alistipes timonensis TaxID=1465754 RepID=UPI00267068DC|nr:hypothetical protein [Alistipes timonensis]